NHSLHPKQPAPRSQNRHRRLLPLQRPSPNPKTLRPSQIHFHHFHPQITLNPVLLFNSIPYPSQKTPCHPDRRRDASCRAGVEGSLFSNPATPKPPSLPLSLPLSSPLSFP